MGLGLYPVFKSAFTVPAFDALGEFLMSDVDKLNLIADDHGLVRLTAFADNREVPEGFDGPRDELDDLMRKWDEWFPALDGAAAFEALAEVIARDSTVAKSLDYADGVQHELLEYARLLHAAGDANVEFRLEVM
jgi:hypothetical protein